MLYRTNWPPLAKARKTLVGTCLGLAFTLAFFLFPGNALAHTNTIVLKSSTTTFLAGGPTFQVTAGFDGLYRDGNWVPFQIAFHNTGADFSGTLSIHISANQSNGLNSALSDYRQPITLSNPTQKQITLYIPINSYQGASPSITMNLLDTSGNVVATQKPQLQGLSSSDILVGVLSNATTGFGPLNAISLPNPGGRVVVKNLDASTLPSVAKILKNFDMLILDSFRTSNLSQNQLAALQSWVDAGGALVEVGGAEWHNTLSPLPAGLLPVTITGTHSLPNGTPLLPIDGSTAGATASRTVQSSLPITASVGTVVDTHTESGRVSTSKTILASGNIPLLVQSQYGQGTICYLAFDPTLEPIVGWTGASVLWQELVFRTIGDRLASSASFGSSNPKFGFQGSTTLIPGVSNLQQSLLPNAFPSPWLLLFLLLGYLLILGPVRLLIVRRLKRRSWSWRIALSSMVVFSFLTYGIAFYEKGTSIIDNTISVVQLSSTGSMAHITSYVGVFVPNEGDYQVHIPNNTLVQPVVNSSYFQTPRQEQTTFTSNSDGTNVDLQGSGNWTLRSLQSEQDRPVQGGIVSHLTFKNGTLTGTVTNTLPYALSDVYVLMPNSFVSIGTLAPGQSRDVHLVLNTVSGGSNVPLANQIAGQNGSSSPYGGPYYNTPQQLQTEVQRHQAILLALGNQNYYGYGPYYGGYVVPVAAPPTPTPAPTCTSGCNFSTGRDQSSLYRFSQVNTNISFTTPPPTTRPLFSGGGPLPSGPDPLLIGGAPATLIGWAASPLDNVNQVTVNGSNPGGLHETLVQAPLSVTLAGPVSLSENFVQGHLIATQGSLQLASSLTYGLSSGSATFEYALPTVAHFQTSDFSLSLPSDPSFGGGGGPNGPSTSTPAQLYNWQTGTWDTISLSQYASYNSQNTPMYIGHEGRMLVRFTDSATSGNPSYFTKPVLTINGNVGS